MKKLNVCVLFGGISPEHAVSLRSAESVLNQLDKEKYCIFPVGITEAGEWLLYRGTDYSLLPSGGWETYPENRRAMLSPVRGQGLLTFEGESVVREAIDVVFPVLHGKNGEDGAIQGLLELAGIPYVGSGIAASAVGMDKSITKLAADIPGVTQAKWSLVTDSDMKYRESAVLDGLESRFSYPVFVKPAGTGSSVGVSKVRNREELLRALTFALNYDRKVLVEEMICGKEVEVAVMGNDSPVASVCGEIVSGADFYDYDAKYVSDSSQTIIPAVIADDVSEKVRDVAVKIYKAVGCQGLSRVDFFVTDDGTAVFNEVNTMPGFTSISMFPKLFVASGIAYSDILDELIRLALEKTNDL